jgi:hypothetical protein
MTATPATEIVPAAPAPAALLTTTARATIMRASMQADIEQRQLIKEYVRANMVEGTDYGTIPGTPKPTLLKPGAEKLVDLFRCEPSFTVVQRVEDWDKNLFHYELKCELKSRETGFVFAQGLGSCNSREGRYRWRKAERTCPECNTPAIIKGKPEYGGGFVCFKSKGGCGAKFKESDPAIIDQPSGRVENDDIASQVNTILKMAKKRALVDASIAVARCSDLFTQDLEDEERAPAPRAQPRQQERRQSATRDDINDRMREEMAKPREERAPLGDPEAYVVPSGKNKGKKLAELSSDALSWYAERSPDFELKNYAQAELEARIERESSATLTEIKDLTENDGWNLSGEQTEAAP